MDYTTIFNNDFMLMTMMDIMSPMTLHHYRCINKYNYTRITNQRIDDLIIIGVQNRLKTILIDKYDLFVTCLQKYKLILHGRFINEVIWDMPMDDTRIEVTIDFDKCQQTPSNHVYHDLNKIHVNNDKTPDEWYRWINQWLSFESEYDISYGLILLHVASHDLEWDSNNLYDNTITAEWQLIIPKRLGVMNKIQRIQFHKHVNFDDKIMDDKYKVKRHFDPFNHFIKYDHHTNAILVCYDKQSQSISLLGQVFKLIQPHRLQSEKIDYDNKQLWIDVPLLPFQASCHNTCSLSAFSIPHFHTCIFGQIGEQKIVTYGVVIDHVCNKNHLEIKRLNVYEFPPVIPNDTRYFHLTLKDYQSFFNYDFSEGEFVYDDKK